MSRAAAALSGLALLAAGVRFWRLGAHSMALDEAYAVWTAQLPLASILSARSDNTPPLYYALLHFWLRIFGQSEPAFRMPSALFGTAAVALTSWVGWMMGGRRTALAATALLALLPLPVIYSQTARSYAFFLCASIASFGLLLRWEEKPGWKTAAAYAAATLAMCYAHNYAVFNLAAQAAYLAFRAARGARARPSPLLPLAAVAVGYVPGFARLLSRAWAIHSGGFWIPRPPAWALGDVFRAQVNYGLHPAATLAYLAPVLAGFWAALRGLRRRPAWGLVCLWAAFPILLPFLYSQFSTPIFWPRYAISVAPALCLLAAEGLLLLPWEAARIGAICGLCALSCASLRIYFLTEREDWRTAALAVRALEGKGDAVVLADPYVVGPFSYYYNDMLHGSLPLYGSAASAQSGDFEAKLGKIVALARTHPRVWLVLRRETRHWGRRMIDEALAERAPAGGFRQRGFFAGGIYLFELRLKGGS